MEDRYASRHTYHQFTLENREKMEVAGVINVESFDNEEIIMETEQGLLAVKGENLHVNHLNLDQGEVKITGYIMELAYSEQKGSPGASGKSLLEKIFK